MFVLDRLKLENIEEGNLTAEVPPSSRDQPGRERPDKRKLRPDDWDTADRRINKYPRIERGETNTDTIRMSQRYVDRYHIDNVTSSNSRAFNFNQGSSQHANQANQSHVNTQFFAHTNTQSQSEPNFYGHSSRMNTFGDYSGQAHMGNNLRHGNSQFVNPTRQNSHVYQFQSNHHEGYAPYERPRGNYKPKVYSGRKNVKFVNNNSNSNVQMRLQRIQNENTSNSASRNATQPIDLNDRDALRSVLNQAAAVSPQGIVELHPVFTDSDVLRYAIWWVPTCMANGYYRAQNIFEVNVAISNIIFEFCIQANQPLKPTFHSKVASVKIIGGAILILLVDEETQTFFLNALTKGFETMKLRYQCDAYKHSELSQSQLMQVFACWVPNDREQILKILSIIKSARISGIEVNSSWQILDDNSRPFTDKGVEGVYVDLFIPDEQAITLCDLITREGKGYLEITSENYQLKMIPMLQYVPGMADINRKSSELIAQSLNMKVPKAKLNRNGKSLLHQMEEAKFKIGLTEIVIQPTQVIQSTQVIQQTQPNQSTDVETMEN